MGYRKGVFLAPGDILGPTLDKPPLVYSELAMRRTLFIILGIVATTAAHAQAPEREPQSPLRPLVVVTHDPKPEDSFLVEGKPSLLPNPNAAGKWIRQDAATTRARLLAERGFVVRDLGEFLLAAPPDLLGVVKAKRDALLMREIAGRAAAGARVLAMKDLSPEASGVLRDKMVGYDQPHQTRVKDAPYLRFGIATQGLFEMRSGGRQRTLSLLPGLRGDAAENEAMKAAVMHPDEEDAAAGRTPTGPPLTSGPPPVADPSAPRSTPREIPLPPPPKGRLTFVVPLGLPGDRGLEWMGTAQAALLKEARAARADWQGANDTLLAALAKVADAPFAHPPTPGVTPGFADLTPEAQWSAAQYFGAENQVDFGGKSAAEAWLRGAGVLSYRTRPVLTMSVAEDIGCTVNLIGFECPIRP